MKELAAGSRWPLASGGGSEVRPMRGFALADAFTRPQYWVS